MNHYYTGNSVVYTMRVEYRLLSDHDFDSIFFNDGARGGGLSDISFYHPVKGAGIFGVFGRLLRKAIPIIKSLIVPELPTFAKNFSDDYAKNNNLRSSLKRNLARSGKNIGKRVLGGARKKKSIVKNVKKCKKRRKNSKNPLKKIDRTKSEKQCDIFNSSDFNF